MKYRPPIGGADNDAYVDANPSTGIEGSPVPAAAIEHPMREIVNVIKQAGLTPDQDNLGQLNEAINKIIEANSITDLGALATKDSVGTTDINNEAITLSKLKTVVDNANKLIGYDENGVPIATELTAAKTDGSNIDKSSFLSKLGFSGQSLGTNGYYKLPNGLIIQWGSLLVPANTRQTVYLPTAYPHTHFAFVVSGESDSFNEYTFVGGIKNNNSTGFVDNTANVAKSTNWISIGY